MYLQTHFRIVSALLIREMSTRFGSKPGGYIWAILEPAAYVMLMTVLFQAVAHTPALGSSFSLFFATGYMAFQFYQAKINYVSGALKSNKALLSYPNVAPIDTVVSRFILQLGTSVIVAFAVIGVTSLDVRPPLFVNWAPIIEAALAASLLALGAALCNTVLFVKFPIYESVYDIVTRPLMLMSGVFFLPDSLPQPFRDIILLNPLVHVIMLFRTGFYPEYRATALDLEYLYGFVFGMLFMGMLLFSFSSRTLRNE